MFPYPNLTAASLARPGHGSSTDTGARAASGYRSPPQPQPYPHYQPQQPSRMFQPAASSTTTMSTAAAGDRIPFGQHYGRTDYRDDDDDDDDADRRDQRQPWLDDQHRTMQQHSRPRRDSNGSVRSAASSAAASLASMSSTSRHVSHRRRRWTTTADHHHGSPSSSLGRAQYPGDEPPDEGPSSSFGNVHRRDGTADDSSTAADGPHAPPAPPIKRRLSRDNPFVVLERTWHDVKRADQRNSAAAAASAEDAHGQPSVYDDTDAPPPGASPTRGCFSTAAAKSSQSSDDGASVRSLNLSAVCMSSIFALEDKHLPSIIVRMYEHCLARSRSSIDRGGAGGHAAANDDDRENRARLRLLNYIIQKWHEARARLIFTRDTFRVLAAVAKNTRLGGHLSVAVESADITQKHVLREVMRALRQESRGMSLGQFLERAAGGGGDTAVGSSFFGIHGLAFDLFDRDDVLGYEKELAATGSGGASGLFATAKDLFVNHPVGMYARRVLLEMLKAYCRLRLNMSSQLSSRLFNESVPSWAEEDTPYGAAQVDPETRRATERARRNIAEMLMSSSSSSQPSSSGGRAGRERRESTPDDADNAERADRHRRRHHHRQQRRDQPSRYERAPATQSAPPATQSAPVAARQDRYGRRTDEADGDDGDRRTYDDYDDTTTVTTMDDTRTVDTKSFVGIGGPEEDVAAETMRSCAPNGESASGSGAEVRSGTPHDNVSSNMSAAAAEEMARVLENEQKLLARLRQYDDDGDNPADRTTTSDGGGGGEQTNGLTGEDHLPREPDTSATIDQQRRTPRDAADDLWSAPPPRMGAAAAAHHEPIDDPDRCDRVGPDRAQVDERDPRQGSPRDDDDDDKRHAAEKDDPEISPKIRGDHDRLDDRDVGRTANRAANTAPGHATAAPATISDLLEHDVDMRVLQTPTDVEAILGAPYGGGAAPPGTTTTTHRDYALSSTPSFRSRGGGSPNAKSAAGRGNSGSRKTTNADRNGGQSAPDEAAAADNDNDDDEYEDDADDFL